MCLMVKYGSVDIARRILNVPLHACENVSFTLWPHYPGKVLSVPISALVFKSHESVNE